MDSCKSLLPDAFSVIAEIFDSERKQKKIEKNMEMLLDLNPVLHR